MWETISNILTSNNAIIVLAFIIILIVLTAVLAKRGIFSIRIGGVKVGINSDEIKQTIQRTQVEWVESDCNDMYRDIINTKGNESMNKDKAQITIDCVFRRFVMIIINNNITLEPTYIKTKQDQIWAEVCKVNPEPKWSKIEDMVRDRTKTAIEQLYAIKKYYYSMGGK